MAVKSISSVSGQQVDYSPKVAQGPGSCTPAKSRGEGGISRGTGSPGNARPAASSAGELPDAVAHLNAAVDVFNKGLHFRIHEDTERIVVEVINKQSGDVIRQIPPEYILDVLAKIDELLGVFVDERA